MSDGTHIPTSVWILVGASGSGKSTLGREMAERDPHMVVVEADSYFVKDGIYQFDPTQLKQAHEECMKQASLALAQGKRVVVANTNLTRWERARYHALAQAAGVKSVEVWLPSLPIEELVARNIHGLTEEMLARQLHRLERG